ncbi:MAG: TIGR04255 family protein [Candidatus Saccharibacteria bacterium]|nr:TIGR04255 family protein [Candidatus Saccharibacteria bacterium]MCY4088658.1 TIGR04255 family protein [Candidatus Saccharibacteria bacterium]
MPNYKKPPIKEAIIEIKFQQNRLYTIESIKRLVQEYEKSSSLKISGENVRFHHISQNNSAHTDTQLVGYMLVNQSRSRVLHVDIDRLSYSFFGEYTGWKSLQKEFLSYWEQLTRLFNETIENNQMFAQRLGVRFVNIIKLPIENFQESTKYIESNFVQDIAQYKKQHKTVREMTKRAVAYKDNYQYIIAEQICRNDQQKIDYFLDIDVAQYSESGQSIIDIPNILANLRDSKNDIFESYLKTKAKELFK